MNPVAQYHSPSLKGVETCNKVQQQLVTLDHRPELNQQFMILLVDLCIFYLVK